MKIFMISLLLIAMINCEDEDIYEDCLNKIVVPRAKEVVQNFNAGQANKNNDIVYNMCQEQIICAFSRYIDSIKHVIDYMYKDIYVKIFQTAKNEELSMIIKYFWNHNSLEDTEKLCYMLLGNYYDCKGLVNSFIDYANRKFT